MDATIISMRPMADLIFVVWQARLRDMSIVELNKEVLYIHDRLQTLKREVNEPGFHQMIKFFTPKKIEEFFRMMIKMDTEEGIAKFAGQNLGSTLDMLDKVCGNNTP